MDVSILSGNVVPVFTVLTTIRTPLLIERAQCLPFLSLINWLAGQCNIIWGSRLAVYAVVEELISVVSSRRFFDSMVVCNILAELGMVANRLM